MSSNQISPSPIGIIDSGVGGLSVLREIHKFLPHESLHYIADSTWCPYGPRPQREIQQRVSRLTEHLMTYDAKAIVIACNSATIAAVGHLRNSYPLSFVGMEPAVKPAANLTQTGTIGILATEASLEGEKFHNLVNAHARQLKVITRSCPKFVQLVENGQLEGPDAEAAVQEIVTPLIAAGVDVIVLGCSHYPFLRPIIERCTGPGITVIDTGAPVSHHLKSLLEKEQLFSNNENPPTITIETSGELTHLQSLLPTLCPGIQATVRQINLNSAQT